MDARKDGSVHLVRLDRGEPLMATLVAYLKREGIRGGSVVGIGSLERSELGFYPPPERRYLRTVVEEPHELLNLTGTISSLEGEPFLHAHVLLGGRDYRVLGGHLFEGWIAVTGEFVIRAAAVASHREYDEATGLKLIRFDDPATGA